MLVTIPWETGFVKWAGRASTNLLLDVLRDILYSFTYQHMFQLPKALISRSSLAFSMLYLSIASVAAFPQSACPNPFQAPKSLCFVEQLATHRLRPLPLAYPRSVIFISLRLNGDADLDLGLGLPCRRI